MITMCHVIMLNGNTSIWAYHFTLFIFLKKFLKDLLGSKALQIYFFTFEDLIAEECQPLAPHLISMSNFENIKKFIFIF